MITTVTCVILSLHFARVFAGNIYRASPAFVLPAEMLARTLGYFTTETSKNDDGSTTEKQVEDVAKITLRERVKFFLHCLLAN